MKYSKNLLIASKVISAAFNPVFSLLFYFIITEAVNADYIRSVYKLLLLILLIILPISVWILKGVKSGKYTDTDVSDRVQRKSLYYFIFAILAFYISVNFFLYNKWDIEIIFLLILLALMQISNYFIKSSMHTALNIFVAALFFSKIIWLGVFWCFISVIVGLTRIILKRHTLQEVVSGSLIAVAVSAFFIYFN